MRFPIERPVESSIQALTGLSCVTFTHLPTILSVNSHAGIKDVFLLGHRRDGTFENILEHVWYASTQTTGATLIADIQALFAVGDDLLSVQRDQTSVVTIGTSIRIQRLDIATLVVVAQPPHTCTTSQGIISACTHVLKQCTFQVPALILLGACT